MTELLSTRQLEFLSGVRHEERERLLRKVLESAKKKEDMDVGVGVEVMKLTNNVTCRVVMSTRCLEQDGEAKKVIELVKESFEEIGFLGVWETGFGCDEEV
ncbi:cytochrome P450 705A22-like [Fagus crenata]